MRCKSNDIKMLMENPRYAQQIKDILFGIPETEKPKNKYGNVKVKTKEQTFDSTLEYKYYLHLKELQKIGEVLFF